MLNHTCEKALWSQNTETADSSSGQLLGPKMNPRIQYLFSEAVNEIIIQLLDTKINVFLYTNSL